MGANPLGQLHARGPVKRNLGRVRNELLGFRRRLRRVAQSGSKSSIGPKAANSSRSEPPTVISVIAWFLGLDNVQWRVFAGQKPPRMFLRSKAPVGVVEVSHRIKARFPCGWECLKTCRRGCSSNA